MQPPTDPPPATGRWVSFTEAQRILGMSEGTLRRAIRAGAVVAEQRRRSPDSPTDQRMIYEVFVMQSPASASAIESDQTPPRRQEPPAALSAALAALTSAMDSERTERQTLAAENADLRERVGRAEAAAAAHQARSAELAEEVARLRAERERRRWWRFWE